MSVLLGHDFKTVGKGRYLLEVPTLATVLEIDRLKRDRFGVLRAELGVRCTTPGLPTIDAEGLVWSEEIAISEPRGRHEIATAIAARLRIGDSETRVLLDSLCLKVRQRERTGEPAVILSEVPKPTEQRSFDVDGLSLLRFHPTIIFGDGGGGKSLLALYAAGKLHQQGVKVGFFDAEQLGEEEHSIRLRQMFEEPLPRVVYAELSYPLVEQADRIKDIIRDHQLDYAIFDSIGFACDGPPENAEVAGSYMRVVRSLGIGSLHLAHVAKGKGRAASEQPFGSTFWHAGARSTWFLTRTGVQDNGTAMTLRLCHRKANTGRQLPDVGFVVRFEGTRTTFNPMPTTALQAQPTTRTVYERIKTALERGPMTAEAMALEIGAKRATVTTTIKRWVDAGELVRFHSPERSCDLIALRQILKVAS